LAAFAIVVLKLHKIQPGFVMFGWLQTPLGVYADIPSVKIPAYSFLYYSCVDSCCVPD